MILTPIVSVVQKEIEYIGGYYPHTTLREAVENIVTTITRQCMIDVQLVSFILKSYGIDSEYQDIITTAITTHLRKVSRYILDNADRRVIYVREGYQPNEIVFEITNKYH